GSGGLPGDGTRTSRKRSRESILTVLRLLLDEHLSPAVAQHLAVQRPEIPVAPLRLWEGGSLLGASDDVLLTRARELEWTLVTYDLRTIAPLLKVWGEAGIAHAGVIFVDDRTI